MKKLRGIRDKWGTQTITALEWSLHYFLLVGRMGHCLPKSIKIFIPIKRETNIIYQK